MTIMTDIGERIGSRDYANATLVIPRVFANTSAAIGRSLKKVSTASLEFLLKSVHGNLSEDVRDTIDHALTPFQGSSDSAELSIFSNMVTLYPTLGYLIGNKCGVGGIDLLWPVFGGCVYGMVEGFVRGDMSDKNNGIIPASVPGKLASLPLELITSTFPSKRRLIKRAGEESTKGNYLRASQFWEKAGEYHIALNEAKQASVRDTEREKELAIKDVNADGMWQIESVLSTKVPNKIGRLAIKHEINRIKSHYSLCDLSTDDAKDLIKASNTYQPQKTKSVVEQIIQHMESSSAKRALLRKYKR